MPILSCQLCLPATPQIHTVFNRTKFLKLVNSPLGRSRGAFFSKWGLGNPSQPNCLRLRGVGDSPLTHPDGWQQRGARGPLTAPKSPFYDARRLMRTAAVANPGGPFKTCLAPIVFLPRIDTDRLTLHGPVGCRPGVVVRLLSAAAAPQGT